MLRSDDDHQERGSEFAPSTTKTSVGLQGKEEISTDSVLRRSSSASNSTPHCEAERRRRQRINGHLATLRSLLPCSGKMDKATLLGEVINQVKVLKSHATEASIGLVIPIDKDEVTVADHTDSSLVKASICCDYKPRLLPDIRQAMASLHCQILNTEISTLGGRVKIVLAIGRCKVDDMRSEVDSRLRSLVHDALRSVVDDISIGSMHHFLPKTQQVHENKRMKSQSLFESSSRFSF